MQTVPSALKRARGNPGKRPINTREATPRVGLPLAPSQLTAAGRAVWDEIGPQLARLGLITEIDGVAFRDFCELEARMRDISEKLKTAPLIIKRGKHGDAKNPLLTLQLEYFRERRAQFLHFGMTPSARAKLIALPPDDDPIEAALH